MTECYRIGLMAYYEYGLFYVRSVVILISVHG